jgi:hypothetical protein
MGALGGKEIEGKQYHCITKPKFLDIKLAIFIQIVTVCRSMQVMRH